MFLLAALASVLRVAGTRILQFTRGIFETSNLRGRLDKVETERVSRGSSYYIGYR